MIPFEDAYQTVLKYAEPLKPVTVSLQAALGFVLGEDLIAKEPVPLFSTSAVDGFAVRSVDCTGASKEKPITLAVQMEVQAGDAAIQALEPKNAIRILTGAPIPDGVDAVVMKEDAEDLGDQVRIFRTTETGANVRAQGEEFPKGTCALHAGTLLTPPAIGLAATLGHARVRVTKQPRVALLITGNELRPPDAALKAGQIRDSNTYTLTGALKAMYIEPFSTRLAHDDLAVIRQRIAEGLSTADVMITVGGVSVGKYDFVREACADLGVEEHFWRVAMKPGKPVLFGTKDGTLVFGLPGNPAAALLTFHLFVRPALMKMMGLMPQPAFAVKARLAHDIKKKAGRLEFVRVTLKRSAEGPLIATPTTGQESHMLGGFATATGIYRFHRDEEFLAKGEQIDVELLQWSLL